MKNRVVIKTLISDEPRFLLIAKYAGKPGLPYLRHVMLKTELFSDPDFPALNVPGWKPVESISTFLSG